MCLYFGEEGSRVLSVCECVDEQVRSVCIKMSARSRLEPDANNVKLNRAIR